MKRLFWIGMVSLACLLGAGAVQAQDEAPLAGDFTDALSLEEKALEAKTLDPALFAIPENASPAELFAFIDGLEEKLPQPTTQEEMEQLINALTDVYMKVADQILAHADATAEDKDKANQQKMVALMAKSRSDEKAADELNAFLDEMIASASDDAAKSQAYQMKIQALMSNAQMDPSAVEKVAALADEILAKETGEELQMLGLEVKAQTFLARMQQDPAAADAMLTFLDPMIASEETAQAVREKAQEIKAVALLISAEQDAEKEPAFEAYFDELLAGPLSPESRQRLYQLRIQTLMPQQASPMQQGAAPVQEDPAAAEAKAKKLDALVDRLMKEDSEELKSLGYAAKASNLLAAVKKDASAIDALFAYADEVLASNPNDKVKEQMAGLKIQGYMMKMQQGDEVEADLLAFIDKMLGENPADQFKTRLASIKVQLLSMAVQKDPAQADALADALTSLADVPGLENLLPIGWANVYMAKINAVAEQKGSIDDLNAVLAQIKEKLAAMPMLAVMLSDMQQALEKIGEANGDAELMEKVFGEFVQLCNDSDDEMLKEAAKALQGVLDLKKINGSDISFEGKEVAPEEKTFKSADLAGKYFLVDLWTTADRGCFEAIEEMKELYGDFQAKGFEIVGINTDENTEILGRVLEVFEMPWIVLSKKMSADENLAALPEVFDAIHPGTRILVGPDGKTVMVTEDLNRVRDYLTEKLGAPEKKADAPADAAEDGAADAAEEEKAK